MTEDEIVDAVASAIFKSDPGNQPYHWEKQSAWVRGSYRVSARAAIKAYREAMEGMLR